MLNYLVTTFFVLSVIAVVFGYSPVTVVALVVASGFLGYIYGKNDE